METRVEVRLAVPTDCGPVAAIVAEHAVEQGLTVDRDAAEQAVQHCVNDPAHLILVAADPQGVAGYIALHWIPFPMLSGTEAYVSDVIVARARRGAGIGRALIEAAEQAARQRGCQRMLLNNRVTAESFVRDFYPKLGFHARDEFRGFVKALV